MSQPRARAPTWLVKLMQVKGMEWILLLIVLGVFLAIAGDTLFGAFSPASAPPSVIAPAQSGASPEADGALEARLARILSGVDGAGRVEVFVAYDAESSPDRVPKGAVVVAEGARDIGVRLALQQAVQTALGVPSARVDVLTMKTTSLPETDTIPTKRSD